MRLFCLIVVMLMAVETAPAQDGGIVIVRHAEKITDGQPDPALTPAGEARAHALAESLADARVVALLATPYQRTALTLQPLSARLGLDIEVVDVAPGGIEAHVSAVASAARSKSREGLVVVAGHSNTVPLIVEALSGRAAAPMPEDEYDRLYLLLPTGDGMDVVTARYGAGD